MKQIVVVLLAAASLVVVSGCKPRQGQDSYNESEVGISRAVEYGTVRSSREIHINGKRTGVGTLLGAGVGAGGGSYVGNGSGNAWATAGAALAGAVAGTLAEEAMNDRTAIEYIVTMQSGATKTIVQETGDQSFARGQKVMLQYCDHGELGSRCKDGAQYQRLLPVDTIPPYVKKKRRTVK